MSRRTAGKRARVIGLVMLVLGAACGVYATFVLQGKLYGARSVYGDTSMTWDSIPHLVYSGAAMIVLIVAGLPTWLIGSCLNRR